MLCQHIWGITKVFKLGGCSTQGNWQACQMGWHWLSRQVTSEPEPWRAWDHDLLVGRGLPQRSAPLLERCGNYNVWHKHHPKTCFIKIYISIQFVKFAMFAIVWYLGAFNLTSNKRFDADSGNNSIKFLIEMKLMLVLSGGGVARCDCYFVLIPYSPPLP